MRLTYFIKPPPVQQRPPALFCVYSRPCQRGCQAGRLGGLYCYRFAIRDHSTKNGYPEVIYEMSQSLYEKFCAQGGNRSVFHAYFVEFAVLPPEGSSEFRLWNASSKLRKGAQSSSRENIEHYAKLPISCAEVVEIFYIRELSYICKTDNDLLFSRV